jgi:hypothetical protein
MTVYVPLFGDIGALSLVLLYVWLLSAIGCAQLSSLKGYGEKPGLGTGLLLSVFGLIVWLVFPSKPGSKWRRRFSRRDRESTTTTSSS